MRTAKFDSAGSSIFHGAPKFLSLVALAFVLAAISAPATVAQQTQSGGSPTTPATSPDGHLTHKGGKLATAATNPVGALIQLQLQNQHTPESQNATGYANTAIVQPVIPISLGKDSFFQGLIVRPTLPVAVTTANPTGPRSRTTGTGDSVVLNALTRKIPGEDGEFFTWGPIASFTLPTATQTETGAGKFQAGPGAIVIKNITKVFNDHDSIMVGGFGYQQWSFAGEGSRKDVSKLFAAPLAIYHFASLFGEKGWYLGLPDDLWTYDFKQDEFTVIPAGLRFGQVFSIGKQPVNLFLQSWYNAADENTSQYTVKLNLTFLFPQ